MLNDIYLYTLPLREKEVQELWLIPFSFAEQYQRWKNHCHQMAQVYLVSSLTTGRYMQSLCFLRQINANVGLPWWLSSKESDCSAGDMCLISGSERSPTERNGNTFQNSCLRYPMDRGAW